MKKKNLHIFSKFFCAETCILAFCFYNSLPCVVNNVYKQLRTTSKQQSQGNTTRILTRIQIIIKPSNHQHLVRLSATNEVFCRFITTNGYKIFETSARVTSCEMKRQCEEKCRSPLSF